MSLTEKDRNPKSQKNIHFPLASEKLTQMKDVILERWLQAVRSSVPASRTISEDSLIDTFPKLLDEMSKAFAQPIQASKESIVGEVFEEHGRQRLKLGSYTLAEVHAEYSILRRTLFELLEVEKPLKIEERDYILDLIDYGKQKATTEFARVSDKELTQSNRDLEDKAQKQNEFMKVVLDSLKEGIAVCDANGKLTLFNRALREYHGFGVDDIPLEDWPDFYDLFKADGVTRMKPDEVPLSRALTEERVDNIKMIVAPKKGGRKTFSASGRALFDKNQNKIGAVVAMHDISDMELIEQEKLARLVAEAAQTKIENILESITEAFFSVNKEWRITYVNSAATRLAERSQSELVGKEIWSEFPVACQTEVYPKLHQAMQEKAKTSFELFYPSPLGRWLEFSVYPSAEGISVYCRDVTARRIAEDEKQSLVQKERQARLEAERKAAELDAIFDSLPDQIFIGNTETFVRVNQPVLDYMGFDSLEDIVSDLQAFPKRAQLRDANTGELIKIEDSPFANAVRGKGVVREFTHVHLKTKEKRTFIAKSTPIRVEGEIKGAVAVHIDITDRIIAEERLRNILEERNATFELSGAGNMIVDIKTTAILEANHRMCEMLGYSEDELLQLKLHQITHPDDHQKQIDALARSQTERAEKFSFERRYLRKDGSVIWAGVFGAPLPAADGETLRNITTIVDITERKEAQEALVGAKEAAEKASELKSSFLANMSHEIRTPMSAILGFTEVLRDMQLTEEERKDAVYRIENSGRALLKLIDDILDISKIEAGKLDIQKIKFSPLETVSEIASLLRLSAEHKGIHLKLRVEPSTPTAACSDPIRVRQILLNLVGNAIKFTSSGEVILRVRAEGQEYLVFDICDTGIGISKKDQKQLFQPFAQADASISRNFGGTGLGLTLSRRLAERMGGDLVLAESTPQEGSRFQVRIHAGPFPAEEQFIEETSYLADVKKSENLDSLTGLSILIAEDITDNQILMQRYLAHTGARVQFADDGEKAVEMAMDQEFDLVLMDIQMPKIDGIKATKMLRASGYALPIVALTAHAMKEEVERSLAAGCNAHLNKPITKKDLIAAIKDQTSTPSVSR